MIKLKELFNESGILYRAGVKKYGKEGMRKIQQAAGKRLSHAHIGKIKDKYEKDKKESVELDEVKPKSKKSFKFKFNCVECGKVFMKKLTPKTFEVQCPKCHGFDVEPV